MTDKETFVQTLKKIGVNTTDGDIKAQAEAPEGAASLVSISVANFYFDPTGRYMGLECSNIKGDYIPAIPATERTQ